MLFNHSKLLGRIKEKGLTQEQLAREIEKNEGTLSAKLNGRSDFTAREIYDICKALEIPKREIGVYFFAE
jgi:transcriptional regulator with XRE-family HTH domain